MPRLDLCVDACLKDCSHFVKPSREECVEHCRWLLEVLEAIERGEAEVM